MDYFEFSYKELIELGEILTKQYANEFYYDNNKIDRILIYNSPKSSNKKTYEIWLQQLLNDDDPDKIKFYTNRFIFYMDLNGEINKFPIGDEEKTLLLSEKIDAISPLIFKDIQLYIIAIQNKKDENLSVGNYFPVIEVNQVNIESLNEDKLKNIYTSILLSQEAINNHLKIKSNFEGNLPQRYISISFFVLNLTREEVLKKLLQLKDGNFDGFRL
jgi:hypothetical protein